MSLLLLWNLCGWWLYPVIHGMVDKHLNSGEVCCNGAEICCCKAGGADACFCLPNLEHNDNSALVCGISTPDSQPNAQDNGVLVFLDYRATISGSITIVPWRYLNNRHIINSENPLSGYIFELLRPPQVG
jgi:hypothetical protein